MKKGFCLNYKAISTIVVGIAFFFPACYPRPVKEKPPIEKAIQEPFALAERDFRAGHYDRALQGYELYLKQTPRGEKSRLALCRMARIYNIQHAHEKALALFKKIIREYPDHPDRPVIKYEIAVTYYYLREYQNSNTLTSEWLKEYPNHPLKGEILYLTGNNFWELGDNPQALNWWIKSVREFADSSNKREEIADRIIGLIKGAQLEELKRMVPHATGSEYLTHIYHRMALIYLEGNRLLEARDAAKALLESTSEKHWISIGQKIIEKIKGKLLAKEKAVACLLPLSGPFAIYGQEVLNGIQLGLGIIDRPEEKQTIELIIKDTAGDPDTAAAWVEELAMEEKVMVIIGPLLSKEASAAAKKAQESGIPIITLTQKEGITDEGNMVYRNFLTPSKEVSRILNKSLNEMGLKRFGILYPDNVYGRFFMNLFWDRAEEMGGMITAVESYKPDQTDFAVEIKKMVGLYYPRPDSVMRMIEELKYLEAEEKIDESLDSDENLDPIIDFDAVFIPDNPQRVALIAPQFPFYDIFDIRLLGTSLWQSSELITMAGDYVQGAIFPSGFFNNSESSHVKAFIDLYRENFESDPGILAATGYDTMEIVKNLLANNLMISREDLQKGLSGLHDFDGVTGRTSFNMEGEVEKEPILLTISGKHFSILP